MEEQSDKFVAIVEVPQGVVPPAATQYDLNDAVKGAYPPVVEWGHQRFRIALVTRLDTDLPAFTIELEHKEDSARSKCSCGFRSDYYPWADYLQHITDAHAMGHAAHGATVTRKDMS